MKSRCKHYFKDDSVTIFSSRLCQFYTLKASSVSRVPQSPSNQLRLWDLILHWKTRSPFLWCASHFLLLGLTELLKVVFLSAVICRAQRKCSTAASHHSMEKNFWSEKSPAGPPDSFYISDSYFPFTLIGLALPPPL